jgi:hypothetical protein
MCIRLRVLALTAFLALPALATADPEIPPGQDGGGDRPTLIRFGNYFLPVAKAFGCDDFQWAAFSSGKRFMSFEYVPDGTDIHSWTRLMTVTVYPLPQEHNAQRDAMTKIEGGLLASFSKEKIVDQAAYTDPNGEPSLLLEYEVGEGLQQEHNVGTFLRSGVSSAAFLQIQSRGKPFDEKDAAHMKQFAEKRLRLPGS